MEHQEHEALKQLSNIHKIISLILIGVSYVLSNRLTASAQKINIEQNLHQKLKSSNMCKSKFKKQGKCHRSSKKNYAAYTTLHLTCKILRLSKLIVFLRFIFLIDGKRQNSVESGPQSVGKHPQACRLVDLKNYIYKYECFWVVLFSRMFSTNVSLIRSISAGSV